MSNPIRGLCVGAGHMGRSHPLAYHQLPGFAVAGVVTRSEASRAALLAELGGTPPGFNDFAEALRLTAEDLKELKVIDRVVPEPLGGAHRKPDDAIRSLGDAIAETLAEIEGEGARSRRLARREKFLAIGTALA